MDCPLLDKCKLSKTGCQNCNDVSRSKDIHIRETNVASFIRYLVDEHGIENIYGHKNQVIVVINGHHFLVQVHEIEGS